MKVISAKQARETYLKKYKGSDDLNFIFSMIKRYRNTSTKCEVNLLERLHISEVDILEKLGYKVILLSEEPVEDIYYNYQIEW